ncbi:MAG: 2TM domain-containing protein [Anaerolineae bacterium]|nr:2TM domain-containing protein [Anaerolineae bacterium]
MRGDIDYDAIHQRVERRIKERQEYFSHLAAYVGVNFGLWMIWLFSGGGAPWPLIVMFLWGIGLLVHTANFVVGTAMEQRRDELIEREIRREKMRLYGDPDYNDGYLGKPKRRPEDRDMQLSDDGELVATDEVENSERVTARKGTR